MTVHTPAHTMRPWGVGLGILTPLGARLMAPSGAHVAAIQEVREVGRETTR